MTLLGQKVGLHMSRWDSTELCGCGETCVFHVFGKGKKKNLNLVSVKSHLFTIQRTESSVRPLLFLDFLSLAPFCFDLFSFLIQFTPCFIIDRPVSQAIQQLVLFNHPLSIFLFIGIDSVVFIDFVQVQIL